MKKNFILALIAFSSLLATSLSANKKRKSYPDRDLVQKEANKKLKREDLHKRMFYLLERNDLNGLTMLFERDRNIINSNEKNQESETPLQIITKKLIKTHSCIRRIQRQRDFPLGMAYLHIYGTFNIADFLLSNGAHIDFQERETLWALAQQYYKYNNFNRHFITKKLLNIRNSEKLLKAALATESENAVLQALNLGAPPIYYEHNNQEIIELLKTAHIIDKKILFSQKLTDQEQLIYEKNKLRFKQRVLIKRAEKNKDKTMLEEYLAKPLQNQLLRRS